MFLFLKKDLRVFFIFYLIGLIFFLIFSELKRVSFKLKKRMGAYRSKPEKDKIYESGGNDSIRFASCSMQGWRINQEDAHNCIVDFMPKMSFFAVYDGHGGLLIFF
jgi:hypothetical protein